MKKERKKGERRAGRPWLTHQCTVRENTWTWPPLRVCVCVCVCARVCLNQMAWMRVRCCHELAPLIITAANCTRESCGCVKPKEDALPLFRVETFFILIFFSFFFFLQRERVKKIVIEWRWRGVFEKSFKFRIYSRGEILGCYESNLSWKLFTRMKSFESFARCLSRGIKKYIFSTSLESFSFESVMLFFRSTLLPFFD